MAKSAVTILKIEPLTHDVLRFEVEKPMGYTFVPGQATSVAINQKGREDDARPFTFTSLPDEDHLEFVIKIYADREGMTSALRNVEVGDELLIAKPWGTIAYKGPGLFLAGGAGITPFIAIFKQLQKEDALQAVSFCLATRPATTLFWRTGSTPCLETPVCMCFPKKTCRVTYMGASTKK